MARKRISLGRISLGVFLQPTGHHALAWALPGSSPSGALSFDHYLGAVRSCRRARIDFAFLADVPSAYAGLDGNLAFGSDGKAAQLDPYTVFSAIAPLVDSIGLVVTSSTSYEEPYSTARRFASLDWISGGRAGWNVVTTAADVSGNFGKGPQLAHEQRYAQAEEYLQVVKGLWDSYHDQALLRDAGSFRFVDTARVRRLDHAGRYFSVRGPLNVARPPQGHPLTVVAGGSEPAMRLAARHADVMFTASADLEQARLFRRRLRALAVAAGRDPDGLLVMPGLIPVLGASDAEAGRKLDALKRALPEDLCRSALYRYYRPEEIDGLPLDAPAPPLRGDTRGSVSRRKIVAGMADGRLSLRELYARLAISRGHAMVVGSPETVADELERWFVFGAADGFNLMPLLLPAHLDEFLDTVVPILRRRGLYPHDYPAATLRENLQLPRPGNAGW